MKPARPRRAFLVSDGLVLVAAIAVGIAWGRAQFDFSGQWVDDPSWSYQTLLGLVYLVLFAIPSGVTPVAMALLILRRRGRASAGRRPARQPGHLACLIAAAGGLHYGVACLAFWFDWNSSRGHVDSTFVLWIISLPIGVGILVGWLTLALVGAWRPLPDWIDRTGRLVGAIWIFHSALRGYPVTRRRRKMRARQDLRSI